MQFNKRTHTCGELRAADSGKTVTLNGWLQKRRDLGGMIFVDIRDRYGVTQAVFSPQHRPDVHAAAKDLRSEYVLSITGTVRHRPDGTRNEKMPTGEIEILADSFEILNRSEIPPFEILDEGDANEDQRLAYRYLHLRRPVLQQNLFLRHKVCGVAHSYFDSQDFIEIETPVLMKSTPEGARDYLVPSRVHPGKFYALPQSPQTYKQLLMVAGFDRYVQIVKCFRDEDLRADRQPEFTQIDLEMSFVTRDDIFTVTEGFIAEVFRAVLGVEIELPLPRLSWDEAMSLYGSDKPDLRFDMAFTALDEIVRGAAFAVFSDALAAGGAVIGLKVDGKADFSRKQLDALAERARQLGLGGLLWMKAVDGGIQSPAAKFLDEGMIAAIRGAFRAGDGDLLLIAAHADRKTALAALGVIRLELGRELGLIDPGRHRLLWVVDFPLFQFDTGAGRWVAEHHPFTGPHPSDTPLLDADPGAVRADCYDLVWNGSEVGSGSIRIHDAALQEKIFRLLGLGEGEIREKFGFLIEAFRYGAPPHGGIALGLDRIVTLLAGISSIRDVIAFPKTNSALSLMDGAPSSVDEKQLRELHIDIRR